jgi:hypothetical protein
MMKPRVPFLVFCFLLAGFHLCISGPVHAQERSSEKEFVFDFRGEPLTEVLDRVARETGIDLVYDPELVRQVIVFKRIQAETVSGLLASLLHSYRLDYITLSSGTIVIVRTPLDSPSYGSFAGKIVDEETGEPLPGASVMLADASGGTSSNRSGHFALNRMMSGTHHIIISYLGYESAFKTIDIRPDQQVQEYISLKPRPVDFAPVVVEAHRSQMPSSNSGNFLLPGSELDMASPGFSPIRNLNLMPGVQYGLPMTDLHLQGGQQGEHRILLDGVPVYNPYSFGRLFSSFSPFALGSVKLHKAGYGVQEGSQMAGLIDLSHDLNMKGSRGFLLQSDPLSLNFKADYSINTGNEKKLNIMTAGRSSFWNFYSNPVLEEMLAGWNTVDPLLTNSLLDLDGDASVYTPFWHDSDIRFRDFHFAAGYEPGRYSTLTASVYLGENKLHTRALNSRAVNNGDNLPNYLYADDAHSWSNAVARVRYDWLASPRLDLSVRAAISENRFEHSSMAGLSDLSPFRTFSGTAYAADSAGEISGIRFALPTQIDGNRIQHMLAAGDVTWSFTPSLSADAGLQADLITSEVNISDSGYLGANTLQESGIYSAYVNLNHRPGRLWHLSYGSRVTIPGSSGILYAEPRASVQYDRPESAIGYWSVRVAGGLYRQFINDYRITNPGISTIVPEISIWSHADDSAIPKAYHLSASLLVEPTDKTTLNLESFYKWQPVTNITSYGNLISNEEVNRNEVGAFATSTSLRAFGAGARLQHHFRDPGLRIIAGYDYSYSRMDLSEQFGREIMTPWNEPHRAQFRAIYRAIPNFSVAARWQGVWGRAWGYRQAYYNFLRFTDPDLLDTIRFDNPGNDRLPGFSQLDLSLIWQPSIGRADTEIRIDLINILNRRNVTEFILTPVYEEGVRTGFERANRTLPGFYPSVSVQFSI